MEQLASEGNLGGQSALHSYAALRLIIFPSSEDEAEETASVKGPALTLQANVPPICTPGKQTLVPREE